MDTSISNKRMSWFLAWVLGGLLALWPGAGRAGEANMAMANGFQVQMWIVDGEKWESANAAEIPRNAFLARIDRNRKPHIFFLLRNPARDDEGNSNITARILIRRPDGSILREVKRLPLWTFRQPFPPDKATGGMRYADMPLKDSDPNGEYTIEATVTDHVTRTALQVRGVLKIEQASPTN
jgi:hypothetical protein